jgi:hypothetical protein
MAEQLLPPLRDFLIAQGIARKPSVPGPLHPLWLDPRNGVPAPGLDGEGGTDKPDEIDENVVFGAFQVSGIPKPPYEQSHLRIDAVDIWIRSKNALLGREAAEPIIAALADQRQFDLGGLTIVESLLFRPLQLLGSDDNGYNFTMEFTFERWT